MKKFSKLLSILLCVTMVLSFLPTLAGAVTQSKTYEFSDYTAGTQYAKDEVHKLDDMATVTTTECHFTSQLRIYSSSSHDGFAIIQFAKPITKISLNLGNKKDTLNVYGSTDGATWTLISGIEVTSTSYNDYELAMPAGTSYTYLKLDVDGSSQLRVQSMTLYYEVEGECTHINTKYNQTETGHQKACSDCGASIGTEETHAYTAYKCVCGKVDAPAADSTLTIPQALALGAAYEKDAYSTDKYYVTGVITEVYDASYGNMYIKDAEGNILTIYGTYSADGKTRYDALETKPVAGDTVTVYGVIGKYNAAQMKSGWITEHKAAEVTCKHTTVENYACTECKAVMPPKADSTLTVKEALTLGALYAKNGYTEGKYYVTGVIAEVYDTTYGNMKVKDAEGNILTVYGTYSADGKTRYDALETKPVAGDTVTVYGVIGKFDEPQMKSGWITAHAPAADPNQTAADAVIAQINALGTITLESEATVTAARTAYDALTDAQKALVTNLETLTNAEATLKQLKDQAAQAAADKAAADTVIAQINAIGEVTLTSKEAIEAARTAYTALTDAQKALVTNLETLTNAEAALKKLQDEAAQNATDKAAADAVIAQIDAIGEVKLESETAIAAARTAYDALTDTQKALVTNVKTLTDAEATLKQLQDAATQAAADQVAADTVIAQIDAIGTVTNDSKDAIEAARAAYEKLTDSQKKLVTNYDDLVTAERAFAGIKPMGDNTVVFFAMVALSMTTLVVMVSKKREF